MNEFETWWEAKETGEHIIHCMKIGDYYGLAEFAWQAATLAARARCAMIADEYADAAERIAQAIRARGAA